MISNPSLAKYLVTAYKADNKGKTFEQFCCSFQDQQIAYSSLSREEQQRIDLEEADIRGFF